MQTTTVAEDAKAIQALLDAEGIVATVETSGEDGMHIRADNAVAHAAASAVLDAYRESTQPPVIGTITVSIYENGGFDVRAQSAPGIMAPEFPETFSTLRAIMSILANLDSVVGTLARAHKLGRSARKGNR